MIQRGMLRQLSYRQHKTAKSEGHCSRDTADSTLGAHRQIRMFSAFLAILMPRSFISSRYTSPNDNR